jgi:phospho-N-acetylmuramoyl-pentapeptide-transferase
MMDIVTVKIFVFSVAAFAVSFLLTPAWSGFLYRHKLGKNIRDSASAPVMAALHAKKAGTPTMGGVLVWAPVALIALLAAAAGAINPEWAGINFLSRSGTWLPLFALVASAAVGLVDDYWNVKRIGPNGGGLRMRHRLFLYAAIAAVGAWWFYAKLDWSIVHIPFDGNLDLRWLFIPFFLLVIVATSFSVNETDGLDGLAGGILATSFAAYGAIAFYVGKYDLAVFCGAIVGALSSFLWFNVNPARFFMGDTGAMSLGLTLGIVAFLVNQVWLLPIIGFVFVIESLSVIIQALSKKIRGKKIFLSTPLHHHFEAKGWPEQKVVMRFWLIGVVTAVCGLALALLDKTL